jgi:hypothetical protein
MELEHHVDRERNCFRIARVDQVEHFAVRGDFLFRAIPGRGAIGSKRLDAGVRCVDSLDSVGRFDALHSSDVLQSFESLRVLSSECSGLPLSLVDSPQHRCLGHDPAFRRSDLMSTSGSRTDP